MNKTGYITKETQCSCDEIKQMLCSKFDSIDYDKAKDDVAPFIRDPSVLNIWIADFFKQITEELKVKE